MVLKGKEIGDRMIEEDNKSQLPRSDDIEEKGTQEDVSEQLSNCVRSNRIGECTIVCIYIDRSHRGGNATAENKVKRFLLFSEVTRVE